ncbi:MAG: ATP-dependent DNA helicase RecG [Verrucomicrobiales bacterium]|nr:MAG: ATP-dependent DNA helicase RecG [Verrucomicrobiales bacterium]
MRLNRVGHSDIWISGSSSSRFRVEATRADSYRAPVSPKENNLSPLAAPITTLWGVGSERAKQLARLDLFTVEDLLLHKPHRYEDRRKFLSIHDLKPGEPATVRGKIIAAGRKNFRKGSRSMFECVLDDGTAHLYLRWWQAQPWMEDYYVTGREFLAFGKTDSLRPRTFEHPETELLEPGYDEFIHVNRIVPIHPLTEGITARVMRTLIWRALERFVAASRESAESFPEWKTLDDRLTALSRGAAPFPARANAVRMIHFPEELTDVEFARQRLALDEFVALQIQIQSRRKKFEASAKALPCSGDNRLIKPFLAQLGFKLTSAQTRVLREIRADLGGAHPMRRLLQGDVGSGKTAVAACTALMALESGFNVALMSPTEILTEQHFRNFSRWLELLGVKVEMQTGTKKTSNIQHSTSNSEHSTNSHAPRTTHHASLFIGTHALLTGGFTLPKLGLVIIDEQHKFGVAQREQLVRKGNYPHLLVMTATPIPRTLGLTLYGDLDLSVIDELPPGRGAVKTFIRASDKLPKVWEFIRQKLAEGRQAYVVYPRVEENADGLKAVTKEFDTLKKNLAPFRVGLLHGRVKATKKEAVMADFRTNRVNVLLATSLIEVGVDVANATMMLIENAESFGLAQLHQLRGRIGRGAHESHCILISDVKKPESLDRLRVMEKTTDGFQIAEEDLKLRGPGELLGQQQSGLPQFRFGDLTSDIALIRQAREIAARCLA